MHDTILALGGIWTCKAVQQVARTLQLVTGTPSHSGWGGWRRTDKNPALQALRWYDDDGGRYAESGMAWVWDPEEAEILRQDHDDGAISSEIALGHAFKLLLETWEPRRRDPQELREDYGLYLQSPHWGDARRRAHLRAGGQCQRCYATDKRLDVHHMTYVRRGHEADMDLIVLCEDCHYREHHDD